MGEYCSEPVYQRINDSFPTGKMKLASNGRYKKILAQAYNPINLHVLIFS